MSQKHDPGDAWHIGWEWYANMWFVEPPAGVEFPDGEPMKWFHERHEAFEFVDQQIREQPVQVSVVDEVPEQPFDGIIRHEDNPLLPPYVPKAQRPPEPEPQPIRTLNEGAAQRVSYYASRVGLG